MKNLEEKNNQKLPKWQYIVGIFGLLFFTSFITTNSIIIKNQKNFAIEKPTEVYASLEDRVMPPSGVRIPIRWGDIGVQMIEAGVIDAESFESIYAKRGLLDEDSKKLLYEKNNEDIVITRQNSGILLNLFWAFGLSNKNEVLETGPMVDKKYGGNPGNFASTAGWSLAVGNSMDHYSKHQFVSLNSEQQKKVESVAKNIYRPCCGNSTYFPDCNHGMAMYGLLELLAYNNISEEEMYEISLAVNSYWFSDTYMTLASYFEQKGTAWKSIDSRIVLGYDYSSANGYRRVLQEIQPVESQGIDGCSV